MPRPSVTIWILMNLALAWSSTAVAGDDAYEPTRPPHISGVPPEARGFYIEFQARNEVGGYGHTYFTLGTVDALGRSQQTVLAGFMAKSRNDDYWSQFGVPVMGWVGVTRSDLVRRPDVRYRVAISKPKYDLVVKSIHTSRRSWTTYELLVLNCNSFASQIARSIGLRTPLITAQYPVTFVSELRALNSH